MLLPLAHTVALYLFRLFLIQDGKLITCVAFCTQQFVELGVNGLGVAMFGALDKQGHHPGCHGGEALPIE